MITQAFDFHLPEELNASHPAEKRGLRRDHVKMLVMDRENNKLIHDCFYSIDHYLKRGDLLVLNNSRTVPAVLKARLLGSHKDHEIRLARMLSENTWDVLINDSQIDIGDVFNFSDELSGVITDTKVQSPIKTMQFSKKGIALFEILYSIGEPIRYEYINNDWSLDYYQTVFANKPGSVEMPSAGRAFTWELLFKLQKKGINIGFIQLHTGLSYLLDEKWDHSPDRHPEHYEIPTETIKKLQKTKNQGGRIIAVGTTVVRALESYSQTGISTGWTDLYITGDYQLNIVDGIVTGLHEPKASHLELLSTFIQPKHLYEAYQEAIRHKYLWHEFGDMNLIL